MRWQDLIFTIGSICFSLGLIPMHLGTSKPPLPSSLLIAAWLWTFTAAYLTLGLAASTASTALTAALWSALAVQAWRRRATGRSGRCRPARCPRPRLGR